MLQPKLTAVRAARAVRPLDEAYAAAAYDAAYDAAYGAVYSASIDARDDATLDASYYAAHAMAGTVKELESQLAEARAALGLAV